MEQTSIPAYSLFVGIDIAAKTLTAAWTEPHRLHPGTVTFNQTKLGFQTLLDYLGAIGHTPSSTLVVMEATGTYWMRLALFLVEASYCVRVVNAAQAHAFAKARLKRAKTDPIDAQTLAQLAARLQPERWTPPPAVYQELQQRLVQRDALVTMRTELRNQLHALVQQPLVIASVQTRLEQLIAHVHSEIVAVESEIRLALSQDEQWARAARRLESVSGIGLLTTAWILVATVNFTLCENPEQATAYAGLAPNPYQSGTSVRGRASIGRGGNARLRRVLYLATLSATRHNGAIKTFYQRLRAAGKPAKVARCAAARTLFHSAWAVVKKDQDFDPHLSCSAI
jgi:transposase